jgi:heptosyltransferase III
MKNLENVLIIRTDRIGDVILTIPMIPFIKKHRKNGHVSVLVRQYTSELFIGNSDIDQVIISDEAGSGFLSLLKKIRESKFDTAFVVSPNFKICLLLFLARIPVRVGTGYRWYSFLLTKKVYEHRKYAENHEVEYNINFLKSLGINTQDDREFKIPILEKDKQKVQKIFKKNLLSEADKIVVIHPGSGNSALNLPEEQYIELANLIAQDKNVKIILTGGKGEENLVENINNNISGFSLPLVNVLNLREMAYLIKHALLFISNSTGPIHIAAAMGATVVGFYAPILACSEKRWGPYTNKKFIFKPDVPECKKCSKKKCAHFNCMEKISIPDVYQKIRKILT